MYQRFKKMGKLKVVYFPLRGRVQGIRLMLEDNAIDYEFEASPPMDWMQNKENTPFGQLPYILDGEFQLAQAGAIIRYLAKKHDFFGENDKENARIDMIQESAMELFQAWTKTVWSANYDEDKVTFEKSLPDRLKYLEKHLEKNDGGKGFFVGKNISYADYPMFDILYGLQKWKPDCLSEFPSLKAFHNRMASREKIAAFLNREDIRDMPFSGSGRI